MAVNTDTALEMVKARLNRLAGDTRLDEYFAQRIQAAIGELEGTGIRLTDSAGDLMLVVDYTVWSYQNRDKPGGMPDWLRLRRRERWLQQKTVEEETETEESEAENTEGAETDDP